MKVYILRRADNGEVITGRRTVYTRPADAEFNRRDVHRNVLLELVEYELGHTGEHVIKSLFGKSTFE